MTITIDLTGLDGEELEQAKEKAETLIGKLLSDDYPYSTPSVNIIMGKMYVRGIDCIKLDVDNSVISFTDCLNKEIACLSLGQLKFEIAMTGEDTYEISEV